MSAGKYRKEHNCLNCGSHVEKHYCSNCGQPNLELKESFWGFISHSIAHYFHFDNKFFQTLVPLLTKPGQVTLDYLAGKRARYINPVSMYIFVSIVYFLVAYSPTHVEIENEHKPVTAAETQKRKATLDSVNKVLKNAGLVKAVPGIMNETTKHIAEDLDREDFKALSFKDQKIALETLKKLNKANRSDSLTKVIRKFSEIHDDRNDSTYAAYLARQKTLNPIEQDNWLDRMIKKRAISIGEKAEVIQETLEHNRPKQYFLMMPLLALFIMWNFRRNHIYYLDHLIFTIHGMTAFFIVSIFTKPLIKYIFGEDSNMSNLIGIAIFVWICWYMFNALKIFYQRKKVVGKMIMIIILYFLSLKLTEMVMLNLIYYVVT
ncbi:DUF3667 domain-containing protein [Pedobacter sp. MC2016-05]|uniref:DUF3667 domain-containing protein n=1 Tax=Pedobacter sp. MC2016-05 TaxID=2994474 RepID=UPI0022461707|nr:DUF3667 domain-containing protein [Pedobacter sp. MC2016-05]MCX2476588.1 DUF3667 domain-containing protein [Pedobacter sp. MC2016-05]